jgi:hypothetical protein
MTVLAVVECTGLDQMGPICRCEDPGQGESGGSGGTKTVFARSKSKGYTGRAPLISVKIVGTER